METYEIVDENNIPSGYALRSTEVYRNSAEARWNREADTDIVWPVEVRWSDGGTAGRWAVFKWVGLGGSR